MSRSIRLTNLANDANDVLTKIRKELMSAQTEMIAIPEDLREGNQRYEQLNRVVDDLDAAANVIRDAGTYLRAAAFTELQE